jgi:hypothetical protein
MSVIDLAMLSLAMFAGWVFTWWLSERRSDQRAKTALRETDDALSILARVVLIEEYQVEIVAQEGFKKLHLRFQDGTGRTYRFEMHPAYAHHFSDDILSKVAMAMKPEMG